MSPFHSFVLAHDIRFVTLTPAHVLITPNLCVIISGDLYETECDVENRKRNRRRSGFMNGLTQFVSISVERHYPSYRYFREAEIELNSNTSERPNFINENSKSQEINLAKEHLPITTLLEVFLAVS